MPIKIEPQVDAQGFEAFETKFRQFKQALDQLPAKWKDVADSAAKTRVGGMDKISSALDSAATSGQRLIRFPGN